MDGAATLGEPIGRMEVVTGRPDQTPVNVAEPPEHLVGEPNLSISMTADRAAVSTDIATEWSPGGGSRR